MRNRRFPCHVVGFVPMRGRPTLVCGAWPSPCGPRNSGQSRALLRRREAKNKPSTCANKQGHGMNSSPKRFVFEAASLISKHGWHRPSVRAAPNWGKNQFCGTERSLLNTRGHSMGFVRPADHRRRLHPRNQSEYLGLGAFARADDAAIFEFVHDTCRAPVAQPQPPLQQGNTGLLLAADDFDALLDNFLILIDPALLRQSCSSAWRVVDGFPSRSSALPAAR